MIYRVDIRVSMGSGVEVVHHFEAIVDSTEEAEEFGEAAYGFQTHFNKGYIETGEAE